jgi:HD-GYP domain-containing protein (c-di-GMP phosphodiesterase class II)
MPWDEERGRVARTAASTLIFGMEVRDAELGIFEHSALVSIMAESLARQLGLSEADAYLLQTAARLHEIGMFTVPPELLKRAAPLSEEELARVRSQALVSSELAAVMHHPRAARLIRHQYDDYDRLQRLGFADRDLLLAGILHVADVLAAVTLPRPYQRPLPWGERAQVLERGLGTRFHPLAVQSALARPLDYELSAERRL